MVLLYGEARGHSELARQCTNLYKRCVRIHFNRRILTFS
jgi:hypothetical protein